ncbi:MAG: ABC transporter ATP-binding protein [Pseudomonadota bacterium]
MLRTEKLIAGYSGSAALHALSIHVPRGAIVAVVGPNGAGKSTLINTISRMVVASSGTIRFEDKDIIGLTPPAVVELGIVQVPEGRQLFAPLTVRENLDLGFHRLARASDAKSRHKSRLDYVLTLFPILKDRLSQRAGTMSGGEQQMLSIGRALMSDPKLLMLDEPSLGLAPMVVERIFEVLQTLKQDGLTILLVEQHADEALRIADYGYVMAVGHVRAQGPGNSLRGDATLQHSYLGRPTEAGAPAG